MKNKQFKRKMFGQMAKKFNCKPDDFWFDGSTLMKYEPPCGFMEGDELLFWWHGYGYAVAFLTADQLKEVK